MAFYRINKQDKFTQIDNRMIVDNSITAKAKGILLYLLSKPNEWKVYEVDIVNNMKDGRDGIRSGIKELIEQGYITRQLEQDDKGKFAGYSYNVYEYKENNPEYKPTTVDGKTENGKTENGLSDNGKTENGKSNTSNTKSSNTVLTKTKDNNIKDIVDSEKTAPEIDNAPLNKNNEMIKEIIEYLNHVTNSKYRYKTAATQKLLNARINEGYTLADFKRVIDVKASQWLNSDMEKFLRPSTLFNATKFDNYANEKPIKPRTNDFKQNRQNDKPKQFEGLKNDVERLQPLLDYTEIADVKQFEMLLTEFKKRYPGGEGLSQELKDMKATSVFSKEERQFTMYVKTELMAGRGDWIVKAITGQLV